jgi:hypothetical protein
MSWPFDLLATPAKKANLLTNFVAGACKILQVCLAKL